MGVHKHLLRKGCCQNYRPAFNGIATFSPIRSLVQNFLIRQNYRPAFNGIATSSRDCICISQNASQVRITAQLLMGLRPEGEILSRQNLYVRITAQLLMGLRLGIE